jgi:Copper amine oxidase N-terminal domain.
MRKYIIGALVGAALTFSATSYGAEISKIGKKVQGEYIVVVDGATLSQKAVGVDGSTYAPLRSIGEELGYDVTFVNKQVKFVKKEGDPVETALPTQSPNNSIEQQIAELEKKKDKAAERYLDFIGKYEVGNMTDAQKQEVQAAFDEVQDLQKQIDALKAQAAGK